MVVGPTILSYVAGKSQQPKLEPLEGKLKAVPHIKSLFWDVRCAEARY